MTQQHDSNVGLSEALRTLGREDDGYSASPAVEARLRAEVRAIGGSQRTGLAPVFAIAASLLLAVVSIGWFTTHGPSVPPYVGPRPAVAPPPAPVATVATAFLPLIHGQLSLAGTHLVRMELPRRALVSFGLASAEVFDTTGTVLADVAVGDDGLARAVRFVQSR
jgi:hypothetical protein